METEKLTSDELSIIVDFCFSVSLPHGTGKFLQDVIAQELAADYPKLAKKLSALPGNDIKAICDQIRAVRQGLLPDLPPWPADPAEESDAHDSSPGRPLHSMT